MVVDAGYVTRDGDELLETQVIARFGGDPEAVPCCASIVGDRTPLHLLLQLGESLPDDRLEIRSRQHVELLLGVVEIVDVDGSQTEVLATALDLIGDIARCQTMTARDDVRRLHDAGAEVLTFEKSVVAFACRRGRQLERNVSALRAHHDFVTFQGPVGQQAPERLANGTLRSLAPIVDGSVKKIDAALQSRADSDGIASVFGIVALAQVGSESK